MFFLNPHILFYDLLAVITSELILKFSFAKTLINIKLINQA